MMEFALRKWEPEDAQTITKYANNPKIANHLRDGFPSPYTLADAEFMRMKTGSFAVQLLLTARLWAA